MRHVPGMVLGLVAVVVIGACTAPAFAQRPGGIGTPGMPMGRMNGQGGGFSSAPPARRSYGVGGVVSSQNFRASTLANQARGSRPTAAGIGSRPTAVGSGGGGGPTSPGIGRPTPGTVTRPRTSR